MAAKKKKKKAASPQKKKAPARKAAASTKKAAPKKKARPAVKRAATTARAKPKAAAVAVKKSPPRAKASAAPAAPPLSPKATDPSLLLAQRVAQLMVENGGDQVSILNVSALTSFADYFVVGSTLSERHTNAVARQLTETMKREGHPPIGVEGQSQSHWVLLDLGGVVVHLFHEAARQYYDLDGLWADAPRVTFEVDERSRKAALERRKAQQAEARWNA